MLQRDRRVDAGGQPNGIVPVSQCRSAPKRASRSNYARDAIYRTSDLRSVARRPDVGGQEKLGETNSCRGKRQES